MKRGNDKTRVSIRVGEIVREQEKLLRISFFDGAEIETEDIMEMFQKNREMMNNQSYYLLTDARKFLSATKDAREYAARNLRDNNVLANAILANSIPVILIVNFYIRFHRPEVPTQMFRSESSAINWLNSMAEKEGR